MREMFPGRVLPAVVPGQWTPNEPPGFRVLTQRSFAAQFESSWGGQPECTIVPDATSPFGPTVGQATYHPRIPCGTGPINTWSPAFTAQGCRELYLMTLLKVDPNYFGNVSGVNKLLWPHIATGGRVILNVHGAGMGPLAMEVRLQGMGVPTPAISWNAPANVNAAAAVIARGAWMLQEVYCKANTPGVLDGQIHFWQNRTKVGAYTSVGFCSAAETGALNVWESVQWTPTYGGGCNGPSHPSPTNPGLSLPDADQFPQDQWMRLARVYASGR